MMHIVRCIGIVALVAAPLGAQTRVRIASSEPFARWVGEWKGTGWSLDSTGERAEFELRESVKERSAGTVLLVEGHGMRTSGATKGSVSHDGIVLVYRDDTGTLRWNGHEAASGVVDAELTTTSSGMSWEFKAQGATIRFVITLDADVWREIGEVSGDGTNWTRFMQMSLRRQRGRGTREREGAAGSEKSLIRSRPVYACRGGLTYSKERSLGT